MSSSIGLSYDEIHPYGHATWKKVGIKDFGGGLQEIYVADYESWSEPDPDEKPKDKAERGQGDREVNKKRAARRSRGKVRGLCKTLKVRHMITLSTRENIQCRKRMQGLVKGFVQRVRAHVDLEYVLVLEAQERGALHVHMAVANKQEYKLLWSCWQAVVGFGEGRVHVTNAVRGMNNVHRIASYLSKYITEDFEGTGLNKKRYWHSDGIAKPAIRTVLLPAHLTLVECIERVVAMLDCDGVTWSMADAMTSEFEHCRFWIATSGLTH